MRSIDSIAEDYVERAAALDPALATFTGIAGHDRELPDLSTDGFAERAELDRSTLAALDAAEAPGLHEQTARAAMQAHSSWDEKRLRFELHRYLGWPGQVPSYKLGERVWLQAREEAKARAGGAFSLKDFHSKALSLGAMGLDPLREALSRC